MQEKQELWHECRNCKNIFDPDVPICPSCRAENPNKLHLTLQDVLKQVGPSMIWTREPRRFDELLRQRK